MRLEQSLWIDLDLIQEGMYKICDIIEDKEFIVYVYDIYCYFFTNHEHRAQFS